MFRGDTGQAAACDDAAADAREGGRNYNPDTSCRLRPSSTPNRPLHGLPTQNSEEAENP